MTLKKNFQPIIKKPKIFKKKEDFLIFYRILISRWVFRKIKGLKKIFSDLNKQKDKKEIDI